MSQPNDKTIEQSVAELMLSEDERRAVFGRDALPQTPTHKPTTPAESHEDFAETVAREMYSEAPARGHEAHPAPHTMELADNSETLRLFSAIARRNGKTPAQELDDLARAYVQLHLSRKVS